MFSLPTTLEHHSSRSTKYAQHSWPVPCRHRFGIVCLLSYNQLHTSTAFSKPFSLIVSPPPPLPPITRPPPRPPLPNPLPPFITPPPPFPPQGPPAITAASTTPLCTRQCAKDVLCTSRYGLSAYGRFFLHPSLQYRTRTPYSGNSLRQPPAKPQVTWPNSREYRTTVLDSTLFYPPGSVTKVGTEARL